MKKTIEEKLDIINARLCDEKKRCAELEKNVLVELKNAKDESDTESAHADADDALCRFINGLGYSKVVDEYNKINKWYA